MLKGRSKYGAVRVWGCSGCGAQVDRPDGTGKKARVCGACGSVAIRSFASKMEFRRLIELKQRERAGEVSSVVVQPAFSLVVNGRYIGTWRADFSYIEAGGASRVEDVKGMETEACKLRRELAEALHGIKVDVIRRGKKR